MLTLNSPQGGAAPAAASSTPLAFAFFLVAAVSAVVIVMASSPLPTLAALAVAYVLSGSLIVLAGSNAGGVVLIVALIKVRGGAIVLAILAISVPRADGDGRLPSAASRLRQLSDVPLEGAARLLAMLALAVALLLAYGVPAPNSPEALAAALPAALLRPAMTLVAGGLLCVLFARSPLRLAAGVLLALVGFELIYARLDPGLVVTGGLAVFQLLFAIVASHFVDLDAARSDPREPGRAARRAERA
jgi:hypothetical protein